MFHAMVRHYGQNEVSMASFKTRKAADKYCAEQFEILKGYNKSYGIVNGLLVIFDNDGSGTFATVFYTKKM